MSHGKWACEPWGSGERCYGTIRGVRPRWASEEPETRARLWLSRELRSQGMEMRGWMLIESDARGPFGHRTYKLYVMFLRGAASP